MLGRCGFGFSAVQPVTLALALLLWVTPVAFAVPFTSDFSRTGTPFVLCGLEFTAVPLFVSTLRFPDSVRLAQGQEVIAPFPIVSIFFRTDTSAATPAFPASRRGVPVSVFFVKRVSVFAVGFRGIDSAEPSEGASLRQQGRFHSGQTFLLARKRAPTVSQFCRPYKRPLSVTTMLYVVARNTPRDNVTVDILPALIPGKDSVRVAFFAICERRSCAAAPARHIPDGLFLAPSQFNTFGHLDLLAPGKKSDGHFDNSGFRYTEFLGQTVDQIQTMRTQAIAGGAFRFHSTNVPQYAVGGKV